MAFEYEFFGPVGTFACTVLLPVVLYSLAYASSTNGCLRLVPFRLHGWESDTLLFSWKALVSVCAFFFGQLALHRILPAKRKEGVVEPNGQRWSYRLNGLQNFAVTYIVCIVLAFFTPYLPLYIVADNLLPMLSGAFILGLSMSIALYASSYRAGAILAPSGTSGYLTYDFWMGRELNPRLLGIDLKEFCELYPGLMGWTLLNLAFAHKQFVTEGKVSWAMLLINAFQLLYVIDGLAFESSILTTMDITSEGFGYMLVFGDLVWVPFSYSIQAKYILEQAHEVPWYAAAMIAGLNMFGYWVFRGANSQKDLFRQQPDHPAVAHLKTLPTERGTKLLFTGWWGVARHINYTGDWLMGLAWCLTCGHQCIIPYFYAVYFAVLLIHRERRDDHSCRVKYGTDWDKYSKLVPYRLIPFVY